MEGIVENNGLTTNSEQTEIKETPKKQLNSLDVTKFMMAILVIAIHTLPWLDIVTEGIFYDLIMKVLMLAVPFFFMSSAYLLFRKMKTVGDGDIRSEKSLKVLKSYSLRMLKLYFIWQLIYLPPAIYAIVLWIQQGVNWALAILLYIKDIIFLITVWASLHLWYLFASCIVSFVYYLMLKLKFKDWVIVVVSFAIYFLGRGARMFVGMQGELNGFLLTVSKVINFVFPADFPVRGFLYFPVAMLLVLKPVNVKWYYLLPIFIGIFALALFIPYITSSSLIILLSEEILVQIANYAFFMMILAIPLKDKKIYFYVRKSSMVIYLIHYYFVFILKTIGMQYGILMFLAVTAISIAGAVLIVWLTERKNAKWLKAIL